MDKRMKLETPNFPRSGLLSTGTIQEEDEQDEELNIAQLILHQSLNPHHSSINSHPSLSVRYGGPSYRRATIAPTTYPGFYGNDSKRGSRLYHSLSDPHGEDPDGPKSLRRRSMQVVMLTASTGSFRKQQGKIKGKTKGSGMLSGASYSRGKWNLRDNNYVKMLELENQRKGTNWPPGYAQERFRHAIRIVLILLKWISTLSESEDDDQSGGGGGGKTFTDIASEAFDSGRFGNSGLTFDVSHYKAKKVINISAETRHILSIPTSVRTPEQIQTALYGLQHLKSFAEYPLHMQEKLCKVAWFQQVPGKRVIIRQGHFAENFYFILSGQAVVRILEKNPKSGEVQLRTATILRKGTSFGELALLHHSRRTATVVSQDTVQLLTIGRDDFFDIFMSGNGPGEIPEHIKFISHLDFMKDWPIDRLTEHPECCLFHFFKRGVVIVKDSTQSDWLYIIKSGSCQVMKQLKGVRPNVGKRCKSTPSSATGFTLPRLGTGDVDCKVDTGRRRPTPRQEIQDSGLQKAINEYATFIKDRINKVKIEQETFDEIITRPRNTGFSKSKLIYSSKISKFCPSPVETTDSPRPSSEHGKRSSGLKTPRRLSPTKRSKTPAGIKTEIIFDPYFDEEGLVLKDPVFVQVQTLKPKDIFGLGTVEFENEPSRTTTSVSLVSNGAECIMLSKKFFVEHANEQVKRTVRYSVRPYPPETALQDNLQSKVDWDVYKKRLIKSTLDFLENGIH